MRSLKEERQRMQEAKKQLKTRLKSQSNSRNWVGASKGSAAKPRIDNQKLQQEIKVGRNDKTLSVTNNKLVENGKTKQLLIDT